jgi:hypothetical protein
VVAVGRIVAVIAVVASSALVAGCGGTGMLNGGSATTAPPLSNAEYLARLGEAQSRLSAAERDIPKRAPTPAALSRAIIKIAVAIRRLGRDLAALRPPPSVSAPHRRLVSIVNTYAGRLATAARVAILPRGELAAARQLLDSTSAASRDFSGSASEIDQRLGQ